MKRALGGVIRITIVLFLSSMLSTSYDRLSHRAGEGAAFGFASTAAFHYEQAR